MIELKGYYVKKYCFCSVAFFTGLFLTCYIWQKHLKNMKICNNYYYIQWGIFFDWVFVTVKGKFVFLCFGLRMNRLMSAHIITLCTMVRVVLWALGCVCVVFVWPGRFYPLVSGFKLGQKSLVFCYHLTNRRKRLSPWYQCINICRKQLKKRRPGFGALNNFLKSVYVVSSVYLLSRKIKWPTTSHMYGSDLISHLCLFKASYSTQSLFTHISSNISDSNAEILESVIDLLQWGETWCRPRWCCTLPVSPISF